MSSNDNPPSRTALSHPVIGNVGGGVPPEPAPPARVVCVGSTDGDGPAGEDGPDDAGDDEVVADDAGDDDVGCDDGVGLGALAECDDECELIRNATDSRATVNTMSRLKRSAWIRVPAPATIKLHHTGHDSAKIIRQRPLTCRRPTPDDHPAQRTLSAMATR
jgi:hypothetical protein